MLTEDLHLYSYFVESHILYINIIVVVVVPAAAAASAAAITIMTLQGG
jgi:hypothetical protein